MDSKDLDIELTTGGQEYHQQASDLIAKCFTEDPVLRFLMSSLSDEARLAYLSAYIYSLIKAAVLNDALIQEANDWSCCAVWLPPGKRVDNPFTLLQAGLIGCLTKLGIGGLKRMLWDYTRQSDACKAKGLRDADGKPIKRYHYLFFIATDPAARGQGIASKVVAQFQDQAANESLPIWLEATTAHSRDIYVRLGFTIVHEMKLGEGTHAANGAMEPGGPGVSIWAMFWQKSSIDPK